MSPASRPHRSAWPPLISSTAATSPRESMTPDAEKRLDALASLGDLGAGFALATHDLEIRGAGELLGEDQSGQIASVGYSLYMDMLEQAVLADKLGAPWIRFDNNLDTVVEDAGAHRRHRRRCHERNLPRRVLVGPEHREDR